MSRILCQANVPILPSREVYIMVAERVGESEISDAAARTIAGWWASPGRVGQAMTALSQGQQVSVNELLTDIANTRQGEMMLAIDHVALDMLGTWALNGGEE